MAPLSLADPAVQSYIVYSAIHILKVLSMAAFTTFIRLATGIVLNPEDAECLKAKVKYDHPTIERWRRAHLNDLENIPAFWLLGAMYLTTGPVTFVATNLFRVYTVSRILHTIVYAVIPLPPPSRSIAFGIPYFIKWYMGIQIVSFYMTG